MERKTSLKHGLVFLFAIALTLGMNVPVSAATKVSKVTTKSPSGSSKIVYVAKGKKVKLSTTVKVTPNKAANKKVTYKSSKKSVATVSSKGYITGKKAGTAKITVTSKKNKKKKDTIKVKVVKNKVTKVKLNKTKASVSAGGTIKLTAKVTAKKGAYKTVKWTSSNKAVATVSKGSVTGKKTGTAKITAKALDGSGKKSVCTVTVTEQKVNVQSIRFVNPGNNDSSNKIVVSLSKAQALSESNFTIKSKSSAASKLFNYTEEIEDFYTSNNIDYEIELKGSVSIGNVVQATVSGINGTNTLEATFDPQGDSDRVDYLKGVVGETCVDWIYANNMLGSSTVKVVEGTLPKGVILKDNRLSGTYQEVADNQKVVFETTDERGVTSKVTYYFVVGDATHLVAPKVVYGDKVSENYMVGCSYYQNVNGYGGSGTYKVALTDNAGGLFELMNSNPDSTEYANLHLNSEKNTKAGTFTAKIKFTDVNNAALTYETTVTYIIKDAFEVTTIINDIGNFDISDVYYKNQISKGDDSYSNKYDVTKKDDKTGVAKIPSGTYDVFISGSGKDYKIGRNIVVNGASTQTLTVPVTGKITGKITYSDESLKSQEYRVSIFDVDNSYESISRVYLSEGDDTINFYGVPAGKYIVKVTRLDEEDSDVIYTSGTITVNNNAVTQDITISK